MEQDPDAAAWERARRLRALEQEDLERRSELEARQAADRVAAEAAADRRRSRRVVALGASLVAVLLVATLVGILDPGSDDTTPAWRQELRTADGGTGEEPQRLAPMPSEPSDPDDAAVTDGPGRSTTSNPTRLDAEERPVIDLRGDDFERVWRQAQLLEGWLLRHPDPELTAEIYLEGSPAHARVAEVLGRLRDAGQKVEVHGYRVLSVEVQERVGPDEAVVRYADTHDGRDVIDVATGAVVQHEDSGGRVTVWDMLLRRVGDQWRVVDIVFVEYRDPAG